MRAAGVAGLAVATGLFAGCQTAVGGYFANRARDFGECFRLEGHVGPSAGVGVKAAGLVHVGLEFKSSFLGAGWVYGRVWPGPGLVDEATCVPARGEVYLGLHTDAGRVRHRCFGLLPCIFHEDEYVRSPLVPDGDDAKATAGRKAEFDAERIRRLRWARVHAFDIEASAAALIGVDVGFSPGEFVDFLLGWFGLDIAGDDRAWPGG